MSGLPLTPSQTIGPFFHDCLLRPGAVRDAVTDDDVPGARVRIHGIVCDGAGEAVADAMLETWQGDRFTRVGTSASGAYSFATIHPSALPLDRDAMHAPHIDVAIFARGLLNHLYTRIYFPDEPANAADPVLLRVPRQRRAALIARREDAAGQVYRFDIVLQGRDESVFFDFR